MSAVAVQATARRKPAARKKPAAKRAATVARNVVTSTAKAASLAKPRKGISLKKAVVLALIANRNKAMHVKDLYAAAVDTHGHVPTGKGKTPLATLAASLYTDDRFEKTDPGFFRLSPEAYKEAKSA